MKEMAAERDLRGAAGGTDERQRRGPGETEKEISPRDLGWSCQLIERHSVFPLDPCPSTLVSLARLARSLADQDPQKSARLLEGAQKSSENRIDLI